MRACILARAPHQFAIGGAFAEGLKRHGWQVSVTRNYHPSDLLVVWGIRREYEIHRQRSLKGRVCVLERGYLGDRFHWTSVSFGGGLNGRGQFRGVRSEPKRFETHFGDLMQPWRRQDGYALLIGQVPGDMALKPAGGRLDTWSAETIRRLRALGHDVRFRAHPNAIKRGNGPVSYPGARALAGSLEDAFAGASVVVTFNSNTAVESVLSGVPTIACDEGSMAREVSAHSVEQGIVTPDRADWSARLAWKQFSPDELSSGFCWEVVR